MSQILIFIWLYGLYSMGLVTKKLKCVIHGIRALALARWPMASKYCLGPVNFSLTGPAWPVKNSDNI